MSGNQDKFGVIESGEFGFFNELDLDKEFKQARLICLTGKNGTGKTQILKFIAKKHAAKSIFNTTEFANKKHVDKREKFDPSRDRAIDIDEFLKVVFFETNIKDKVELTNTLFKTATYGYKKHRKDIVDIILKIVREKYKNESVAKDILHSFGYITEEECKEEIGMHIIYKGEEEAKHNKDQEEAEHNPLKTKKKFKFTQGKQKSFQNWWNNKMQLDKESEDYLQFQENLQVKKSQYIDSLYSKQIHKTFSDFTQDLNAKLFDQIDINNLISELADDIFEDYKGLVAGKNPKELAAGKNPKELAAGKNPKESKTKWYKINNELEKLSEGWYFNYKLVKPDVNLGEYDIVFEYIGEEKLKNYGEVHFDDLSTGEKKIFTLMVYKYILNGSGKDTYEYLMLDEFDANLNPALIKFYINTLREIIRLNNNITILFTTHSSLTLKALAMEFEGKENDEYEKNNQYALYKNPCVKLYEVEKNVKDQKHGLIEIENNKFEDFLDKYSENIMLVKQIYDKHRLQAAKYIIIVEGKSDKEYLESYLEVNEKLVKTDDKEKLKKDDFYITTDNGGGDKTKNCLVNLDKYYKIEELSLKDKYVFLLFDYDRAGDTCFRGLFDGEIPHNCFDFSGKDVKNLKLNIDNEKINCLLLYPITKEAFNENFNNNSALNQVEYPYSVNKNDVIKNDAQKNTFLIEDLIVAYNVDLYNKYLKDKKSGMMIESFFTKKENKNSHKTNVEKFFKEYKDKKAFNPAGFDLLFKRMAIKS